MDALATAPVGLKVIGLLILDGLSHVSQHMTKSTKWMGSQDRVGSTWEFTQSDQSSLCTQRVAKDSRFLHADSEDRADWADA